MPPTFADAWRLFHPGDRVYVAGAGGEPAAALDALAADPALGRGLDLAGIWIPGANRRDPTAGVPGATASAIFITPELARGFAAGRIRHLPLHYSDAWRWLAGPARCRGAIFQVSPPEAGSVSLGTACDFTPAVLATGAVAVGQVNPAMPVPPSAPRIPVERFAYLIEAEAPLADLPEGPLPPETLAIGRTVADLVAEGDTLELGLGKVNAAVLAALAGRSRLSFHAGMIAGAMAPHLEAATFASVTTGVVFGPPALHRAAAADPRVRFAPVSETHDPARLAALPGLVTVNGALEIDLLGQANGETRGGRQVSGIGGLADFHRAGRGASRRRAILALPATADDGRTSRIRACLRPGSPVSVGRADADIVVTEHGAADLRWSDIDARAEALIGIAAPAFRDGLAAEWAGLRRTLAGDA
jgi:acyl-CoA hydrolase